MTKRIIGFSTIPTPSRNDGNSSAAEPRAKKSVDKAGESEEVLALMRLQKESIERFKRRFPNGATIEEGEFLSTN